VGRNCAGDYPAQLRLQKELHCFFGRHPHSLALLLFGPMLALPLHFQMIDVDGFDLTVALAVGEFPDAPRTNFPTDATFFFGFARRRVFVIQFSRAVALGDDPTTASATCDKQDFSIPVFLPANRKRPNLPVLLHGASNAAKSHKFPCALAQ
jgi:hypothetical protein